MHWKPGILEMYIKTLQSWGKKGVGTLTAMFELGPTTPVQC